MILLLIMWKLHICLHGQLVIVGDIVDQKDWVALTITQLTKVFQPFVTNFNVLEQIRIVSLDYLGGMLLQEEECLSKFRFKNFDQAHTMKTIKKKVHVRKHEQSISSEGNS